MYCLRTTKLKMNETVLSKSVRSIEFNILFPLGIVDCSEEMSASQGKSSLFVGDLSIFCSEAEIESAFSAFGDILEIKIMRSEETSRNLSYGFIKFVSSSSAKKAMSEMNGVLLCGRPLRSDLNKLFLLCSTYLNRIRWASYKNKQSQRETRSTDVLETSPVHVSFISYQVL